MADYNNDKLLQDFEFALKNNDNQIFNELSKSKIEYVLSLSIDKHKTNIFNFILENFLRIDITIPLETAVIKTIYDGRNFKFIQQLLLTNFNREISPALEEAIEDNNHQIIDMLLYYSQKQDITKYTQKQDITRSLEKAAEFNNVPILSKLLKSRLDANISPALEAAIDNENFQIVNMLLSSDYPGQLENVLRKASYKNYPDLIYNLIHSHLDGDRESIIYNIAQEYDTKIDLFGEPEDDNKFLVFNYYQKYHYGRNNRKVRYYKDQILIQFD